jgi:G3E family GTPase
MKRVKAVLIGGFLGAGKTTLLAKAGALLAKEGKRVGLLTNDQAPNLVDTAYLRQQGFTVGEVCGGCFCCQFDKFLLASHKILDEHAPDVLLAEPVGSCTDISATVVQPLKKLAAHRFEVAPFSVVLDPLRLREALLGARGNFIGSVNYIYEMQVEEADVILLNKCDLLSADEINAYRSELARRRPNAKVFAVSAARGEGIEEWLAYVQQNHPAGQQLASVDYDTYAAGEAALGWFNSAVELRSLQNCDWRAFAQQLIAAIQRKATEKNAEIAHLKMFIADEGGNLVANLTSTAGAPSLREDGKLGLSSAAQLLLNARVQMAPEALREMAEGSLQAVAGNRVTFTITELSAFSPSRPQPTHRFTEKVG